MAPFQFGTVESSSIGDPLRVVEAYLAGRRYAQESERAPYERRKLAAEAGTAEAEAEKARLLMMLIRAAIGGGTGAAAPSQPFTGQPIPRSEPGVDLPEAGPIAPTPFPAPTGGARGGGTINPLVAALLGIPRVPAYEQWVASQPPGVQAQVFGMQAGTIPKAGEAASLGLRGTGMALEQRRHEEKMAFEKEKHQATLVQKGQEFALKQQEFISALMERDAKRADSLIKDLADIQKSYAELGPEYASTMEPIMQRNMMMYRAVTGEGVGATVTRPKAPKKELDEAAQAGIRKRYLEDQTFKQFVDILAKTKDDKTARTALEYIVPRMREAGVDASIEEPGLIRKWLAAALPFVGAPPRLKIEPPKGGGVEPAAKSSLSGQRTNRSDGQYKLPSGEVVTVKDGVIQ